MIKINLYKKYQSYNEFPTKYVIFVESFLEDVDRNCDILNRCPHMNQRGKSALRKGTFVKTPKYFFVEGNNHNKTLVSGCVYDLENKCLKIRDTLGRLDEKKK